MHRYRQTHSYMWSTLRNHNRNCTLSPRHTHRDTQRIHSGGQSGIKTGAPHCYLHRHRDTDTHQWHWETTTGCPDDRHQQTYRNTDRHTDKQAERQTDRLADGQTETDRTSDRWRDRQRDRQRQTDRYAHTDGQMGRQTQRERQTDRQGDLVQWSGTSFCCSVQQPVTSHEDWHVPWSDEGSTTCVLTLQTFEPEWTSDHQELAWCQCSSLHVGNSCAQEPRETAPWCVTHNTRETIPLCVTQYTKYAKTDTAIK